MAHIKIRKWTIATVQVIYFIPDHLHILNEFMWQTEDELPEYPRIKRFLDYWDKNIDGPYRWLANSQSRHQHSNYRPQKVA